jgi:hypothetical protein
MSIVSQLLLIGEATPISETYNTSGDHEVVVAQGEGKRIIAYPLIIQVQGTTTQTISVKSGETVILGPIDLAEREVLSVALIGGLRFVANEALIVSNSEAEDVVVTGGYFVK